MRRMFAGAFVVAGLVIAGTAAHSVSQTAPAPSDRRSSTELITHMTVLDGERPQVLTVIDPRQRVVAVYHVDRTSGQISPKSVRNISWDLQMIEFNSGKPLPQDIRSGLQQ